MKALVTIFFIYFSFPLLALLDDGVGVSSNPSPADHIGTGDLGRLLLNDEETGLSLECLWIVDGNQLFTGGVRCEKKWSVNNLVQFELLFDPGKISCWQGALFAIEYLQLNGAQTNGNAGLVQGFEGLIEDKPLSRSQFYAWWYRQELLDGNLIFRIGKSTPNADFNSVNRLFPMNDKRVLPEASGLIYGTIFTHGSISSFLPSYYNSAFGASLFYFPVDSVYVGFGGYDGNKARGKQTGLRGPQFNGYYFLIGETGISWSDAYLPGRMAVGVWRQTGKLGSQQGAVGMYFFASQRLYWQDKENTNSGLVTYLQLGINNSKTTSINKFLGWGITAYGLVPERLKDSFGFGLSLAGLNHEPSAAEWMFQGYYQCHLFESVYLEPVLSYIPKPGAQSGLPPTWAATFRLLSMF